MIPYCVDVLQGKVDENNRYKITKPVAVILLAHLVGDIHQPLHVGAEYFDDKGKPVDPDKFNGTSFGDTGGNDLMLTLLSNGTHGTPHGKYVLHTYWDDNAVDTAFEIVREEILKDRVDKALINELQIIRRLAASEPPGWRIPGNLAAKELAVAWADAILPVAKEAHDRLDFERVIREPVPGHPDKMKTSGQAIEKEGGASSYHDFAGNVAREQMQLAGWRLAALLEQVIP
jgi:hypothetical protein